MSRQLRVLQPSMSHSELLLNCAYPYALEGYELEEDEEVDEPARYGSAFHELMSFCLSDDSAAPPAKMTKAIKNPMPIIVGST